MQVSKHPKCEIFELLAKHFTDVEPVFEIANANNGAFVCTASIQLNDTEYRHQSPPMSRKKAAEEAAAALLLNDVKEVVESVRRESSNASPEATSSATQKHPKCELFELLAKHFTDVEPEFEIENENGAFVCVASMELNGTAYRHRGPAMSRKKAAEEAAAALLLNDVKDEVESLGQQLRHESRLSENGVNGTQKHSKSELLELLAKNFTRVEPEFEIENENGAFVCVASMELNGTAYRHRGPPMSRKKAAEEAAAALLLNDVKDEVESLGQQLRHESRLSENGVNGAQKHPKSELLELLAKNCTGVEPEFEIENENGAFVCVASMELNGTAYRHRGPPMSRKKASEEAAASLLLNDVEGEIESLGRQLQQVSLSSQNCSNGTQKHPKCELLELLAKHFTRVEPEFEIENENGAFVCVASMELNGTAYRHRGPAMSRKKAAEEAAAALLLNDVKEVVESVRRESSNASPERGSSATQKHPKCELLELLTKRYIGVEPEFEIEIENGSFVCVASIELNGTAHRHQSPPMSRKKAAEEAAASLLLNDVKQHYFS